MEKFIAIAYNTTGLLVIQRNVYIQRTFFLAEMKSKSNQGIVNRIHSERLQKLGGSQTLHSLNIMELQLYGDLLSFL
ncbi:hypothetical protein CWN94_08935 [Vibrio splendidus]|uniref:Uncharacterized protein n=1 Tax=Vibrio splendidus TaxID=29497 RepID=A0A2R6UJR4_VIBSP|nr:hypothetical protein [Vibrio splendidus]RLQ19200.1 hypothetical protein AYK60_03715 [Vibrio sp. SBT000027]HAS25933.1 hypothetical protein [Vibrio sp.]NOJ06455.1 hypothetical protein [Vibrio splendidus]NOJ10902.1 hypothetical protein [Vibrio splendidus]